MWRGRTSRHRRCSLPLCNVSMHPVSAAHPCAAIPASLTTYEEEQVLLPGEHIFIAERCSETQSVRSVV